MKNAIYFFDFESSISVFLSLMSCLTSLLLGRKEWDGMCGEEDRVWEVFFL